MSHDRALNERRIHQIYSMPNRCTPVLALAALLLVSTSALGATPGSGSTKRHKGCLRCHADPALNRRIVDPSRRLVLDMGKLAKSVHADLDCTECHTQLADAKPEAPHAKHIGKPKCDACHEDAARTYLASVHGVALLAKKKDMALCGDCHGAHDILPVKDLGSRVSKMRLPFTCAKCHENERITRKHKMRQPHAAQQYKESIHGRGLLVDGLIVAPSCTDCHGGHNIEPSTDPRSPIYHANVPKTCGKCHVGIVEVYDQSIHGQLLAKKDPRGPVCVDCHTAHDIDKPTKGIFKLASDERCGKCHADRLRRYRETYHGKAIALGQTRVAACYDCHGHHDILPVSNPKSRLAKGKRLGVCRKCHPAATTGFIGYMTHGDHTDKEHFPKLYWAYVSMTLLLLGVFGFFGLHTLLWFTRSIALFVRDPHAFRAQKVRAREGTSGRVYVRFRPVDRFCHFLVIISFLLLVITGMPLKFYQTDWAHWLFRVMGGPQVAAALHRLGAVLTGIYFAVHIVSVISLLWRHRGDYRDDAGHFRFRKFMRILFGPDSPMPNWQDVKDFWAHQKWFFGRGPRPQFDRWTYWEKFDYLAVFWGVAVIGLSGLVMWIPTTVTRFAPGWIINIAQVIHSDEALLAAGFIFTFHFFNVHFRVEKFPMDSVIFSGRITEEEMLHERARLYSRLEATGRLERERLKDEWHSWKRIFNPIGMLAFLIGVVLIVAIYIAMASRMLGE